MEQQQQKAMVASPCIGICRLDVDAEVCVGCYRSLDEITRWASTSDADRRQIIERAEKRRHLAPRSPAASDDDELPL